MPSFASHRDYPIGYTESDVGVSRPSSFYSMRDSLVDEKKDGVAPLDWRAGGDIKPAAVLVKSRTDKEMTRERDWSNVHLRESMMPPPVAAVKSTLPLPPPRAQTPPARSAYISRATLPRIPGGPSVTSPGSDYSQTTSNDHHQRQTSPSSAPRAPSPLQYSRSAVALPPASTRQGATLPLRPLVLGTPGAAMQYPLPSTRQHWNDVPTMPTRALLARAKTSSTPSSDLSYLSNSSSETLVAAPHGDERMVDERRARGPRDAERGDRLKRSSTSYTPVAPSSSSSNSRRQLTGPEREERERNKRGIRTALAAGPIAQSLASTSTADCVPSFAPFIDFTSTSTPPPQRRATLVVNSEHQQQERLLNSRSNSVISPQSTTTPRYFRPAGVTVLETSAIPDTQEPTRSIYQSKSLKGPRAPRLTTRPLSSDSVAEVEGETVLSRGTIARRSRTIGSRSSRHRQSSSVSETGRGTTEENNLQV